MDEARDPIALLAERIRGLAERMPDRRILIGIAGSPGSGKTTTARAVVERLGADAVAVPMDGFHLANATLDRLGRHDRKGAIDTFDGDGFAALVARLRAEVERTVYAPAFERTVDEPVAGSIAVEPAHRIAVIEGNYLLVDAEPWRTAAALLDERWFCATPEAVRLERLVDRHTRHGRTPEAAAAWARDVDGANAVLIEATRGCADLVVSGADPGVASRAASA